MGDRPDVPFPGSRQHYAGALGDYACCVGTNVAEDFFGDGGNGAIIIADWRYKLPVTQPRIIDRWQSQTRFRSITDGLSQTIFIGEKHVLPGTFGTNTPANVQAQTGDGSIYNGDHPWVISRAAGPLFPLADKNAEFNSQFGSWHNGVCQFAMGDGSVQPLSNDVDPLTWEDWLSVTTVWSSDPSASNATRCVTDPAQYRWITNRQAYCLSLHPENRSRVNPVLDEIRTGWMSADRSHM